MSAPKIKRKRNRRHNRFSPSLAAELAAPTSATPSGPAPTQSNIPIDVSAATPRPPFALPTDPMAILNASAARRERTLALLQEFHRHDQRERPDSHTFLNRLQQPKYSASAPAPSPAASIAATSAPKPTTAAPASSRPHAPGHSTGPRTPEGKARSAQNAHKHGLTAPLRRTMEFLPDEDPDQHERLRLQFNEQFVPMTSAEFELVAEIVDALWLARRARDLQTRELFLSYPDQHLLSLYLRYETTHTRAHQAAIKTLLSLQKDRRNRNQHHEEWNEPLVWGFADGLDLDTFTFFDDDPPEPEEIETTSASPTAAPTSFRNHAATPATNPAKPTETSANPAREEVKPAA